MTIRHLSYVLTNSGSAGQETDHYVDLARDLSAINRQLMRQGRMYRVKRVSLMVSPDEYPFAGGSVTASVIPDGWVTRNAWKRGFDAWNKMRKNAVTATGMKFPKARWADFKVHMSRDSVTGTQLVPKSNEFISLQRGEWSYSTLTRPITGGTAVDPFTLHMVGDHIGSGANYTSVGLIRSYGETRYNLYAEPSSNNIDSEAKDDPLANLMDEGDAVDEVLDDYASENNLPPYYTSPTGGSGVGDYYVGGQTNFRSPIMVAQGTFGNEGRCTLAGFDALAGLIQFQAISPVASTNYRMIVEVAEGTYKGVRAEAI